LESWPPDRIIWSARDLWLAPRRPDAPRISYHRQQALIHRLDALESLRVLAIIPSVNSFIKTMGLALEPPPAGMGPRATETVHATGWAVRRGARDPRSSRGAPTDGITQKPLYD